MFRNRITTAVGTLGLATAVGLSGVVGGATSASAATRPTDRTTNATVAVMPHTTAEQENGHSARRPGRDTDDVPATGNAKGYAIRLIAR